MSKGFFSRFGKELAMPASAFMYILQKSVRSLTGITVVFVMLAVTAGGQSGTLTDGQTPLGLEPGAPAGSYALSGLDNINLFNGNLNFRLPLMQIGGRGEAQMTMSLPIELKWKVFHLFIPEIPPNPPSHTYLPFPSAWSPIQPGYGPGVLIGRKAGTEADCGTVIPPHIRYTLTRLTFITADGTEYELRDQLTQGKPADLGGAACSSGGSNFGRGKVFVTADGSSMTFISDVVISDGIVYSEFYYPTGYLFLRDGTRFRIEEGLTKRITDRNGNWLNYTYDEFGGLTVITDSLNRAVNITYPESAEGFDEITWKGSQGTPRSIKIYRGSLSDHLRSGTAEGSSSYTLKTLHDLFPEIPGLDDTNDFDWLVISAVELPDGRQYRFYYNSYAELARVELPTGGAYEYDHTPTSGVLWVEAIHRRVVERRVYPNGLALEGKTTYAATDVGNNTEVDVNHKAPDGTFLAREKHYFNSTAALSMSPAIESVCYGGYLDGKEYLTESYDTNGNVIRKVENSYAQREAVPWWSTWTGPSGLGVEPPNDTRLTQVVSTLSDVMPNLVSKQTFDYDQFNNITDTCNYDFGSGAAGPLLRHTRNTYVTNEFNSTDYTTVDLSNPTNSVHLRSLPLAQIVNTSCTDNQTALAKTEYEYDNYTAEGGSTPNHAALLPRSSISGHDDAVFSTARLARGNVTSVRRWIDSTNSASTFQFYDVAGNTVKSKDGLGKVTQFDYADRFGIPSDDEARGNMPPSDLAGLTSFAFATKVTNALGHESYAQFDYNIGKPVNSEDANLVVASLYYEAGANQLDRPVKLINAANFTEAKTQALINYDDASRTRTTSGDLTTFADGLLTSVLIYDGLGRTIETRKLEPGGYITTTQSYDSMGRAKTVSNPFRATSENTYGTAVTSYDALSRVISVASFDKNNASTGAVTTEYLANKVTVTDQAGKKRRSVTDGLGRLIRVDEPDAITGNLDDNANPPQPLQPTTYGYDVLSNLITVTQQSGTTTQTRRFAYDKMSRLIFAANPEQNTSTDPLFTFNSQQWAVKYEYDTASNLKFKTDTRKPGGVFVKTTYVYDDLHRVSSRSYTGGTPTVTYSYDTATKGVGRLASVSSSGVSTTNYTAYDPLGRPLDYNQQTGGSSYAMHRTYNRAGLVTSETYPSLKVIQTEYDSAGRIAGVSRSGSYYAGAQASDATNRVHYSPAGGVDKMKLGNGLWEHTDFNSRLQPLLIGLGTGPTLTGSLKVEYDYGTTGNNGNLLSQKITAPTAGGTLLLSQSYTYDKLNRLLTANEKVNQETNPRWTQGFTFDRWGNRTGLTNTGELPPANQLTVNPATNRFSALLYDEVGNQLSDESGHPITYDAENHQKSFSSNGITYNYSYDGDGRRVKREYNDGALHTTIFVYNASGQLIAEYNSDPVPPPQAGGGVSYLTTDHLGSPRVVTNLTGAVKARHDYLPFGEDVASNVSSRSTVVGYNLQDGVRQKFTQKERDNESGLDYFLARYYSSAQGRFTSPDEPLTDQWQGDPQSWNLYVYVRNNPLLFTDPTGMWHYEETEIDGEKHKIAVGDYDNEYVKGVGYWNSKTREWGKYHDWTPGLSSFSRGVFLDLARREKASIQLIDIAANITLTPISIISGTALFRAGGGLITLGKIATNAELVESATVSIGRAATAVGRAFQKHAARGGKIVGEVTGNAAKNTEQGVTLLKSILESPNAVTTIKETKAFGQVLEVKIPGGVGARFTADGRRFIGFLE
jgi:RHS repeat-associated protein